MAALMTVGVVTVLLVKEPERELHKAVFGEPGRGFLAWLTDLSDWFVAAVVNPFADFFQRNGRFALVILLFIGVYRLSDISMGIMANPFYLDMGYSKGEIASIAKVFGFVMSVTGSFLCGLMVVKWGIYRPMLLGAILVASTNLLFAAMAGMGPDIRALAVVISADNISGGIAGTAFVAYLSGLTNRAYTATQYALFSSLMTLPGKFFSGFSGVIVDAQGYMEFFVIAALIGLPAILLVPVITRHETSRRLT